MSKFGELINAPIPVLIDFYTEWNDQSISMHPVIRDVAAALGDKAKVIKIDIDQNTNLANRYHIQSVPTLMIFKNGEEIYKQAGVHTKPQLMNILLNNL